MKFFAIVITFLVCSYFIGNGIVEATRWGEVIDLNKEREVQHINQSFELELLRTILFELEQGNKEVGIKYLKEYIDFNNGLLQKELADNYISEQGRDIISKYLTSKAKGFE
ncbi:hypothetical protein CW745_16390 [Psychromonas sp. psych-6C06]|uniref:hypothetical protein n=1 Tax=Psychromonas sp. psych-6C06 TaxID=2058089 RepID=UPI000C32AEFD|nr:hypothetical protein [Psychromonas sp. psych-6C06]PKF60173.1 hypothetical protein CW745_16390 [Psychromonas sp. psych-6C06]